MRTIIDIPEKDIRTLDVVAKRMNISRAELVRRCVTLYLEQIGNVDSVLTDDIFGNYRDVFRRDGVKKQQEMREGWRAREDFYPDIPLEDEKQDKQP